MPRRNGVNTSRTRWAKTSPRLTWRARLDQAGPSGVARRAKRASRRRGLTGEPWFPRGIAAHAVDQEREEAVGEHTGVAPGLEPGVGPVGGREEEECGSCLVEIGAQLAEIAALAEELADPFLVPPALGDELFPAGTFEVPPLLDEDGGDVELLGHDPEVTAQSKPDLLHRRCVVRNCVEGGVERGSALRERLVEEVLLRGDVRVERALLDAEGLGDVPDRRAVVALLREEPSGLAGQLGAPLAHDSRRSRTREAFTVFPFPSLGGSKNRRKDTRPSALY